MRIFTWQMAEELAEGHMRALGFADARRTALGTDGGADVHSSEAVAQVKYQAQPVGSPVVQRLRGAAFDADFALFYASSGYTSSAIEFANSSLTYLFEFDTTGEVFPVNDLAVMLIGARANPTGIKNARELYPVIREINALLAATRAMEAEATRRVAAEVMELEAAGAAIADDASDDEVNALVSQLQPRAEALERFVAAHLELADRHSALGLLSGTFEESYAGLTSAILEADYSIMVDIYDRLSELLGLDSFEIAALVGEPGEGISVGEA